jgi:hypothetical protein
MLGRSMKEAAVSPGARGGNDVVVYINGTPFATGLFWQPLTSPRDYMAEVRSMAKTHGWDVVTVRKGRRIQAGFGSRSAGTSKGMYSLSAALAHTLGQNWVGAFDLGNGRCYVCAVKDNLIVPGFDSIEATDGDAVERLTEAVMVVAPTEAQRYAPARLGLGYRTTELGALLDPKRLVREHQLRPLRIEVTRREWTAVGLAVALVTVGLVGIQKYEAHKQRQLVAERIRADQERRAKATGQPITAAPGASEARPNPWAVMPSAVAFARACDEATGTVPLSVGGWLLEAVTCDRKGISIAYRRPKDGATAQDLATAARGRFAGEPAFADEGGLALLGKALGVPFAGDEALPSVDSQLIGVVSYFQEIGVTPSVSEAKPEDTRTATATDAAASEPLPAWRRFNLSYEALSKPIVHFTALQAKPGLRLTEIKVTLKPDEASLKWNVKGEIYAAR